MKLGIGVFGVLTMCALLVGCAPQGSPTPGPTAAPTEAETAVPAQTPTPTPTLAADPQVRVPLSCGNLFTNSAVGTLIGSTTVKLAADENTPPTDLESIAERQRGILTCTWGGKYMTDSGYDKSLSLSIEPDAASDFAENIDAIKGNYGKPTINTYGDQSAYACNSDGGLSCGGQLLVGGYWMTADLHSYVNTTLPTATARSRIKTVFSTMSKALEGAGDAAPAWVPPAGGLLTFCSMPGNTTIVRKAFSSPSLKTFTDDEAAKGIDVTQIGQSGESYAGCEWEPADGNVPKGQQSDVVIQILDGAIWSVKALTAVPPTNYYVGKFAPVSIPGADGGVLACNGADCTAIVGIGTNAVELDFDDFGTAKTTASLKAIVAALAAS